MTDVSRRPHEDECAIRGVLLKVDQKHATYSGTGYIKPTGDPINGPDYLSSLLLFFPNHLTHKQHDFDLQYAKWHAGYFGHIQRP